MAVLPRNFISRSAAFVSNGLVVLRTVLRERGVFLIPPAIVAGVTAGVIVTVMSELAQYAHVAIFKIPIDVRLSATDYVSPTTAVLAPAIGGGILGGMDWLRRRWKISNAVDPIEANALRGGHLSLRDSGIVGVQTLISNGCGASVGLEAGYTQVGAGLASVLGRAVRLRRDELRLMVGCGAAGAISAAFGAPLTGAFYACELIVGVYSIASAAPILVASIAAALTARTFGGAPYSLGQLDVATMTISQYPALIALALTAAGVGIVIMRSATIIESVINQPWLPIWARPILGGVLVGALALATPQVLAAGHGAMMLNLHSQMLVGSIALIIGLKIVACLISLGFGFRGGLFFASLFIGSLLGKLFSGLSGVVNMGATLDPNLAMLVGMATMGVAIVGGPLTMSFLVLEMTKDVDTAVAVLAAAIVTSVSVRSLFGHSFTTWRLHLRGETIRNANDIGWTKNLTVRSMMRTDVAVVQEDETVRNCRLQHLLGYCKVIFVIDSSGLYCGSITPADLFAGQLDAKAEHTSVSALIRDRQAALISNMDIKTAMQIFDTSEAEHLAVIEDASGGKVVGFLSEAQVRRRYAEELDKVTRGMLGST